MIDENEHRLDSSPKLQQAPAANPDKKGSDLAVELQNVSFSYPLASDVLCLGY